MPTWDLYDAAHLLRRAGFGGNADQVLSLHALGREGAIAALLDYEPIPDPTPADLAQFGLDTTKATEAIAALLYRMMASPRPLQEKLTWFWHGHFTSAFGKCPAPLMMIQNETWRRLANGNFETFLLAMYQDPAMLVYLDNNTNVVGRPNENFAREVMELFTLGIGNYTETDIREAARALTGWKVQSTPSIAAVFVPRKHDEGSKTVLGVSGNLNGDDVMRILARHPATARHVCTRLYQFFVQPQVPAADLDTLVNAWNASGGNIKAVMGTLLRLDAFWSPQARSALVKSPVEYALGLMSRLETPLTKDVLKNLVYNLASMGQQPFNPPDVAGYPVNLEWAGTSLLLARYNYANNLIHGAAQPPLGRLMNATGADVATAAKLANFLFSAMGPFFPTHPTYQAVLSYIDTPGYRGTATEIPVKTKGALHLIASCPEYQLN